MILDLRKRMNDWIERYDGDATNRELVEDARDIIGTATTTLSVCGTLLCGLLPDDLMTRLESDDSTGYMEALQEALAFAREEGAEDHHRAPDGGRRE